MIQSKQKYFILFLTYSGAGTHLIRSSVMEMISNDKAEAIDFEQFWAKAAAALYFPAETAFEKSNDRKLNNSEIFQDLCRTYNCELGDISSLDEEKVFELFNQFYSREPQKIILDFTHKYTTASGKWTQKYVNALKDLILGYARIKDTSIKLKFLVQVRNPIDHIASLFERFGPKLDLNECANLVKNYLSNVLELLPDLPNEDTVFYTLDELVNDFSRIRTEINNKTGIEIQADFYLSNISLDKWLSCPFSYKYLHDEEVLELASKFDYRYSVYSSYLSFIYYFKGKYKREIDELQLVRDVVNGKINKFNSVLTKHKFKGSVARIYLILLKMFNRHSYKEYKNHISSFNENLVEFQKKRKQVA